MRFSILVGIMCLFLFACAKVDVNTDYDRSYDFSKLKTFGWLQMADQANSNQVKNPEVAALIETTIEKHLNQKGYKKLSGGQADFMVGWAGAKETKVKVESIDHLYASYGYGPVAKNMPEKMQESSKTREYQEGTLIIDLADPKSHVMFWRGTGTGRLLQNMDKEEARLYIEKLVRNIFESLPKAQS